MITSLSDSSIKIIAEEEEEGRKGGPKRARPPQLARSVVYNSHSSGTYSSVCVCAVLYGVVAHVTSLLLPALTN